MFGAKLIGNVPNIEIDVFGVENSGNDSPRTTKGFLEEDPKCGQYTALALSKDDMHRHSFKKTKCCRGEASPHT